MAEYGAGVLRHCENPLCRGGPEPSGALPRWLGRVRSGANYLQAIIKSSCYLVPLKISKLPLYPLQTLFTYMSFPSLFPLTITDMLPSQTKNYQFASIQRLLLLCSSFHTTESFSPLFFFPIS